MTTAHPPLETAEALSFSSRVKDETSEAHDDAEHSTFMNDLLGGELDAQAYIALLEQYLHLYRVLEAVESRFASAPELAGVIDARLHRTAALEKDLAELTQGAPVAPPTAATAEYMERLGGITAAEPERFFAHHYLRYLGDLSGGQVIGRLASRHYALPQTALRTWQFDGIEKLKVYKDGYREAMDAAPLTPAQQDSFVAEAAAGFTLARDLFESLKR